MPKKIYDQVKDILPKQDEDFVFTDAEQDKFKRVSAMREELVKQYENTSLLSRIARWILPNSWSEAGRIQDQIDELDKAVEDAGYSKSKVEEKCSAFTVPDIKMTEEEKQAFQKLLDLQPEVDKNNQILFVNDMLIKMDLNLLAQGKLYKNGTEHVLDSILRTCDQAINELPHAPNVSEEDKEAQILNFQKIKGIASLISENITTHGNKSRTMKLVKGRLDNYNAPYIDDEKFVKDDEPNIEDEKVIKNNEPNIENDKQLHEFIEDKTVNKPNKDDVSEQITNDNSKKLNKDLSNDK